MKITHCSRLAVCIDIRHKQHFNTKTVFISVVFKLKKYLNAQIFKLDHSMGLVLHYITLNKFI